MKNDFKIRPYARLLTMLGEQLIKNERIALAELAKNSYDADANWVKISFVKFGKNMEADADSVILIEDDGCGMSLETIKNQWLSPATPFKKISKRIQDTSEKGRKIQGEKGIGRFAVLKLGKKVIVTTRPAGSKLEHVVNFDFSKYDNDFLSENNREREIYLDDLSIEVDSRTAKVIVPKEIRISGLMENQGSTGTRIEISGIKGIWTNAKVKEVFRDLTRLQSIFDNASGNLAVHPATSFQVAIDVNGEDQDFSENYVERLQTLLTESSVFQVEDGQYNQSKKLFSFKLNGFPQVLHLADAEIAALRVFRDHFGTGGDELKTRSTECGSFSFGFYVFDFSATAEPKYSLDKDDKSLIKDHRIYLYRDGIRVYPYGEPDDDWLRIDAYRGTISAGQFLSNDQVVGYVNISEKGNPGLKDKTNREGLIETGNPTDDFICLLQTFLAYVRSKPYAQYRAGIIEKKAINCAVPCDHIPRRSWPLFRAKAILNELIADLERSSSPPQLAAGVIVE